MIEDQDGLTPTMAALLGFDEPCARCGHDYGLHAGAPGMECTVLDCPCGCFTRIKPEPSGMHVGDSVVFGDRQDTYEVIAEWPDPATLPPLDHAALLAARRAMQLRIIEQLAVEVDVCKRIGSIHLAETQRALDIMLKIYGEDNDAENQEGQEHQQVDGQVRPADG